MKIGSLFSGYGGLDIAVEQHYAAETVWHAEFEEAPSKVLAHHWPGVPNHHDVSVVDWSAVEPVDIITGGFPCQDVSEAGRRAGMTDGTRSNLWGAMRTAIETIRPRYAVIENVRGLLSATAQSDSDLEQQPGFMGNRSDITLRALGRVLGDLADIGYDAQWHGLRAADIGAPHGRYRIFIVATNTEHDGQSARQDRGSDGTTATPGRGPGRLTAVDDGQLTRGHTANGRPDDIRWGAYEPAIRRWERVTERPAPAPTELSAKDEHQLSPVFVEWIMGLDQGHVTGLDGISRADQIKMLGNGVVPQQALEALRRMTSQTATATTTRHQPTKRTA